MMKMIRSTIWAKNVVAKGVKSYSNNKKVKTGRSDEGTIFYLLFDASFSSSFSLFVDLNLLGDFSYCSILHHHLSYSAHAPG